MEVQVNPGIFEAALEIAVKRSDTLRQLLKSVLDDENLEAAKGYARQLRGDAAKPPRVERRYPRSLALVKGK